jgi:cytochrome c biogenesis protein CcmG, thiol:disulfide interchange protein DsbE
MPYNVWHQNCVFKVKTLRMNQRKKIVKYLETEWKSFKITRFRYTFFFKTLFLCTFTTLCLTNSFAQKSLPDVQLKDLKGQVISSKNLTETSQPTIISFWATWCKPCLQEINAIAENLDDWQLETKLKFIAISVDDSRSKARVPTFVNAKKWQFDVYIDENGDFQRALNVLNVPHTFILDANGKIIYQHTSYASGDEEEYIDIIRKLK